MGGAVDGLELVVLGSAGWVPQTGAGRMTTSLALRTADLLILFDAGVGLSRLAEPRFRHLLKGGAPVHLFLSHLHLDHTVGLTFLPGLWQENPVTIHVPGEAVTGYPAATVLDGLVGPPFFPHRLAEFPMAVTVEEVLPGSLSLAGLTVAVRAQRHAGGSLGYRAGDALAFLTDTSYDADSAGFAAGVGILVHEAWTKGDGDPEWRRAGLDSHTSAEDAARVARDAEVGELLLSHLPPLGDEAYHAEMLDRARAIFPRTFLCEDGLSRRL
jgi:ribonuclease BN (tRNA processing enzyme)